MHPQGKLWVDVGFWAGLVPANARDPAALRALLDGGALGFKAFLCPSGAAPCCPAEDVHAATPASWMRTCLHASLHSGLCISRTTLVNPCMLFHRSVPRTVLQNAPAHARCLQPRFHAHGAGINDFPNVSLADVAAALPVLRSHGVPLIVHSELDDGTTAQASAPRAPQIPNPNNLTVQPRRSIGACTHARAPVALASALRADLAAALAVLRAYGVPLVVPAELDGPPHRHAPLCISACAESHPRVEYFPHTCLLVARARCDTPRSRKNLGLAWDQPRCASW